MSKYTIAFGSPFDGLRLIGPFNDYEVAREYAEDNAADEDWWVTEMEPPNDTTQTLAEEEKPLFAHDCQHCTFLGTYEGDDLYHCAMGLLTVVARYGNLGWEYRSGMMLARIDTSLGVAKERALKRGLPC